MMKRSPHDEKRDSDRNCDSSESNDLVYINIYIPELQNEVSLQKKKFISFFEIKQLIMSLN
jgi:hypothetical protein